jgi:hypothetical protein
MVPARDHTSNILIPKEWNGFVPIPKWAETAQTARKWKYFPS